MGAPSRRKRGHSVHDPLRAWGCLEHADIPRRGPLCRGRRHAERIGVLWPRPLSLLHPSWRRDPDANPNGSERNIAGIVNERGNVLGMMPHPERACEALMGGEDGLLLWQSVVEWAKRGVGV